MTNAQVRQFLRKGVVEAGEMAELNRQLESDLDDVQQEDLDMESLKAVLPELEAADPNIAKIMNSNLSKEEPEEDPREMLSNLIDDVQKSASQPQGEDVKLSKEQIEEMDHEARQMGFANFKALQDVYPPDHMKRMTATIERVSKDLGGDEAISNLHKMISTGGDEAKKKILSKFDQRVALEADLIEDEQREVKPPPIKTDLVDGLNNVTGKPIGDDDPYWMAKLMDASPDQLHLYAEAGSVLAMRELGNLYMEDNDEGVKINYRSARKWLKKAVDAGDPIACYNYGMLLKQGLGGGAVGSFRLC
jgi:hypothetical protein